MPFESNLTSPQDNEDGSGIILEEFSGIDCPILFLEDMGVFLRPSYLTKHKGEDQSTEMRDMHLDMNAWASWPTCYVGGSCAFGFIMWFLVHAIWVMLLL